jgi:hypothetical protein
VLLSLPLASSSRPSGLSNHRRASVTSGLGGGRRTLGHSALVGWAHEVWAADLARSAISPPKTAPCVYITLGGWQNERSVTRGDQQIEPAETQGGGKSGHEGESQCCDQHTESTSRLPAKRPQHSFCLDAATLRTGREALVAFVAAYGVFEQRAEGGMGRLLRAADRRRAVGWQATGGELARVGRVRARTMARGWCALLPLPEPLGVPVAPVHL